MCMIVRVCILHTNRNRIFHISEGENDKYLMKDIKFISYCSIYHSQLYLISCTVSDCVFSTVACCRLLSKQIKLCCLFPKESRNNKMNRPDCRTELGIYTVKTVLYIIPRRITKWVNLCVLRRMCR